MVVLISLLVLRRFIFLVFFSLGCAVAALAQQTTEDYLPWSATHRLTVKDFRLGLKQQTALRGSTGIYGLEVDGNIYDLLGKRSNQIVRNRMLCTASWIDTTDQANIAQSLLYQQTLFDISEIYARQLRQKVRASAKRMFLIGKPDIKDLMTEVMKASERRQVEYTEDTIYATLPEEQAAWEQKIRAELQALDAYKVADK